MYWMSWPAWAEGFAPLCASCQPKRSHCGPLPAQYWLHSPMLPRVPLAGSALQGSPPIITAPPAKQAQQRKAGEPRRRVRNTPPRLRKSRWPQMSTPGASAKHGKIQAQ